MANDQKKWLVRTRGGDFLGPYSESELISEVNAGVFSPDDEIAPSRGYWVSAQKLVNREDTEFTKTSTRHTSTTKSISIHPDADSMYSAPMVNGNLARAPQPQQVRPQPTISIPPRAGKKSQRPVLIVLFISLGIVGAILIRMVMKPKSEPHENSEHRVNLNTGEDMSFLDRVDEMIRAGERGQALNELTQKHQSSAAKEEVGYLIPYAGLLITEGVSTNRAEKLLRDVLNSPKATNKMKSEAHRWLGYILLYQDKDDRGVQHFLQSLLLDPKDTAAKFNLGRAYLKEHRSKEALEYFKLAELEAPDLWLIHIYKGHAKVELNDNDEARYNLRRAAEISGERWLAYIYYGLFLNGVVQEREAAKEVMQMMLTKDPFYERNSPPPFGYFYVEENYTDYLASFETIMRDAPTRLVDLGKHYLKYLANGPDSAEGKYILKIAKNGTPMTQVIALKVLLDNNAPPRAIREVLKRLPANLEEFGYYSYVLRGEALMKLGESAEAGENLKRALLMGPKTAVSRLSYAQWLHQMGKEKEAQEELSKILSYHPNYIPAIRALRKYR